MQSPPDIRSAGRAPLWNRRGLQSTINACVIACALMAVGAATAGPLPHRVSVVQTTVNLSQRLTALPKVQFGSRRLGHIPVIDVDDSVHYQRFTGIGAAMTDSSAWAIQRQLSPATRTTLMARMFGVTGLHLNVLRVPMGASDYVAGSKPYSYDDRPPHQTDPTLSHFSIEHDRSYIIPTLRQARAINPGLQILANPWSPPAWMKTNASLNNDAARGRLLASGRDVLAQYFVKFLKAYASAGVPVQAITPQNEPSNGIHGTSYPGLTMPEAEEAAFVAQHLAPALHAAGLPVKIYGGDLSWNAEPYEARLLASAAAPALAGIASHCYGGSPAAMTQLHSIAPTLDQIASECSSELAQIERPEYLIASLRNWASLVTLWNLALDPDQGPKLKLNGCPGCYGVAKILPISRKWEVGSEYYQLGQVSKYVQPGADRISSRSFVAYGVIGRKLTITGDLDDVAFLNPNGSRVLIAYNRSASPIQFGVSWHGRGFKYRLSPRAMVTFTWDRLA